MKSTTALILPALASLSAAFPPAAMAAPTVTRLNPPSALFTFKDPNPPYIARFATGQRFDLQATIKADDKQVITGGAFYVDNVLVPGTVTVTPISDNRFSLALRAYSNTKPGVHTLSVLGTQDNGVQASDQGNFEVVGFKPGGKKARNIIYLIGDGMGIAHRTAARIITGNIKQGKAESGLAIDSLPTTGIVMTHSLNSIVTDSAPGAACYSTGNKSNNNQEGVFPDDTSDKWDNPRVEHMGSYLARTQGKVLGIVTNADVEDATPASFAVHTSDRGAGTGICDMFLDEGVSKANLRVLMGGGRKWFLPKTVAGSGRVGSTTAGGADYVLPADTAAAWGVPAGLVDENRNLIADFEAAGFTYAADATALAKVSADEDRILGLFHTGNMDIAMDKIAERRGGAAVGTVGTFPDQPMLDEMTDKALATLSKNRNGFVLMIEGASIDKQAHNMDTERWVLDTVEFDRAVGRCIEFMKSHPETLVLVTADHECAGINIIGGSLVTNAELVNRSTLKGRDRVEGLVNGAAGVTGPSPDGQIELRSGIPAVPGVPAYPGVVGIYTDAGFPQYDITVDGYPKTMDVDYKMIIGYAGNGDRYEDWLTNPNPNVAGIDRDKDGDFFIAGQAAGSGNSTAVHTASDIPISAGGRGASAFTGVMDNTEVFFRAMQAAIGGAK